MKTPQPDFFEAEVLQFLMPNGEQRHQTMRLPMEVKSDYDDMLKAGCRFEAEMLRTGEISVTISDHKADEDLDCSITSNGPDVQKGMIAMLKRATWRQPREE